MELFLLEENLIQEANVGNLKSTLNIYKKLFKYFHTYTFKNKDSLRYIKNYLISLNQSLYENFCNNIVSKYDMYKKRNHFRQEIEKNNCINVLYDLGKEIIFYYTNTSTTRTKKCIYTDNPIIKETLNYIHNNINKDLSLKKVANKVHVSKNHLSNLFSQNTGYNFSTYVNQAKIEKSKMLLTNTNNSILNIAIESGFNSQSYFCSTFKKFTGTTPTKYRKNNV